MTDWMEQAACKGMDPTVHHPQIDDRPKGNTPRGPSDQTYANAYAAARRVCAGCPVVGDCLAHAIDKAERYGMWGGMDPRERIQLVGRRRCCSECGKAYTLHGRENRTTCGREECVEHRKQRFLRDAYEARGTVPRLVGTFPTSYRASPVDWSTVPVDDPRDRAADAAVGDLLVGDFGFGGAA